MSGTGISAAALEGGRFRFAPSPTGHLHIGGVRTALFNWLLARKHHGAFVLRIEDTDRDRSSQEYTEAILEGFRWLGMDWDEGPDKGGPYGPYVQSERTELYRREAVRLVAEGKAYPCFCPAEVLEAKRQAAEREKRTWVYDGTCRGLDPEEARRRMEAGEPHTLRLRVEPQEVGFEDLVRGPIGFRNYAFDDFIILRSDGMPVYNFAVVVDDSLMRITHVLRGDDHIPNTPRQILIYRALGYPVPAFGHLSMILGPDGQRLSKRHGATSIQQFREEGFLPEAMLNFLARLGWSYDDTQEIFSREELVAKFSLDRVNPAAAVFNREKLVWLNGEYMRRLTPEEKFDGVARALVAAGLVEEGRLGEERSRILEVIRLVGERLKVYPQIVELAGFVFRRPEGYDAKAMAKFVVGKGLGPALAAVAEGLRGLEAFTAEGVQGVLEGVMGRFGLEKGVLMQAVRIAVTGRAASPDLAWAMALTGREECVARLERLMVQEGV